MAGRITPSIIRLNAPPGTAIQYDFAVDIGTTGRTLVASIAGSSAITLEGITVQKMVEVEPDIGDPPVPWREHDDDLVEVHYEIVAQAGAGEPFAVIPGQIVWGTVRGLVQAGAGPGLYTATLKVDGFGAEPDTALVRLVTGRISVETLDSPAILHQDTWDILPLRISLPGATGTEVRLSVDSPADGRGPAKVVPPDRGKAAATLAVRLPKTFFPLGPAVLRVWVDGLTQSPFQVELDVEVVAAPPRGEGPVELNQVIWDALGAALSPLRVKFVGFHCQRESTEWSGSEEPQFFFGALPARATAWSESHSEIYGNVDAGQTRSADLELYSGRSTALAISIVAVEHDSDDPERIKEMIEGAYDRASEEIAAQFGAIPVVGPFVAVAVWVAYLAGKADAINGLMEIFGPEDDIVGSAEIVLTPRQLREYAGTPPSDYFGIPAHFASPVITREDEGAFVALFRVEPA